jgi:hypothetical protein
MGMKVTAFTSNMNNAEEIKGFGANVIQSSVDHN